MVYGRNHCVTLDSDIDLLFVLRPESLSAVLGYEQFRIGHLNEVAAGLFTREEIDCVWTDHTVDGVLLNMGIVRSGFFDSWSRLKSLEVRRCRKDPSRALHLGENSVLNITALGDEVEVKISVAKIEDRYLVTEPLYYGGVLLPKMLYGSFLLSETLYDKHGAVQRGVEYLLRQLVELYGTDFVLDLVSYGLSKSSPEFLTEFHRRIGKCGGDLHGGD